MKNLILIGSITIITIFSAYLMLMTDSKSEDKKDPKQEKSEKSKSESEDKGNSQKKQDKELQINNQQDLQEIIYSEKDEQIKMNAYNQAIEKGVLPRSNNYQEAVYAFEESVWIKNNTN
ncbi:hypothetical protein JTF04_07885 [Mammaliicoccus vitulinus]|uniref:hypothetical protein n=1 Tax=Mammaliicoccus vitulinus TaxID=71237 RepID=UPI0019512288|nr:hypothetical protein [Mammaliicoccus vitulinus]MBM6629602.1 hypothetical protein [Mammaliicoccus vitulinus]